MLLIRMVIFILLVVRRLQDDLYLSDLFEVDSPFVRDDIMKQKNELSESETSERIFSKASEVTLVLRRSELSLSESLVALELARMSMFYCVQKKIDALVQDINKIGDEKKC